MNPRKLALVHITVRNKDKNGLERRLEMRLELQAVGKAGSGTSQTFLL
jgi:hypothetical protein